MDGLATLRAGLRRQNVANDGDAVQLRADRFGGPINFDWIRMLSLEGRVFSSAAGTLDTPLATQLAYDVTKPSHTVDIPPNVVVIPLFWELTVTVTVATTHAQLLYGTVRTMNATAAAYTAITPLNVRLGSTRVPACKSCNTVTVTGGDPTSGARYLTHRGNEGDLDAIAVDGTYKWSILDQPIIPMIDAGGCIAAYYYNNNAGSKAFSKLVWAELDIEDFRLPQN